MWRKPPHLPQQLMELGSEVVLASQVRHSAAVVAVEWLVLCVGDSIFGTMLVVTNLLFRDEPTRAVATLRDYTSEKCYDPKANDCTVNEVEIKYSIREENQI